MKRNIDFEKVFKPITEEEFETMMTEYARTVPEDCNLCCYQTGAVEKDYTDGKYYALCSLAKAVVENRLMCDCKYYKKEACENQRGTINL